MATVSKNFKVKNGLEAGSTIFSAASTTAAASLNIPHGTAPTSPANGDFWTTSSGAYVRINGVTVGPLASSAGSGTPWGTITGTLSSQTDLQTALDAKLNLSGGTLTGSLTLPGTAGTRNLFMSSGYAVLGLVTIGRSGAGYGTIGDGYRTTSLSNSYNYDRNDYATMLSFSSGAFSFQTSALGTAGNPVTFAERFFINNAGDISNARDATIGRNLTVTGTTTLSGDLTISKASPSLLLNATSGSPSVNISGVAGTFRGLQFKTAGTRRWTMYANADAESGSDVGSDFAMYRANDAGSETRVMYIQRSTGNVTFDNAVTLSGDLTISKASPYLTVNATSGNAYSLMSRPAGSYAYQYFQTAGNTRWTQGANTTAESGSDAGSDFVINRYSDAGALLSTPLTITRSTGLMTLTGDLTIGKASPVFTVSASSGNAYHVISAAASATAGTIFRSAGSTRWVVGKNETPDSSTATGSDFVVRAYDNNAALLSTPLTITRSTGATTFTGDLTVSKTAPSINALGSGNSVIQSQSTSTHADLTAKSTSGGYARLNLDRPATQFGYTILKTAGSARWSYGVNDDIEAGSNTGSSFFIYRYDDAGVFIDVPLKITRSTGTTTLSGDVVSNSTTDSTTTTTGAIKTAGGIGVAKAVNIGTTLNVGTSVTIGTETAATREYVNSKVMNLVTNGTGLLGNNYNFPGLTYDQTQVFSGLGSFKWTGNYTNTGITEYIPVDTGKTYRFQYAIKQTGSAVGATFYGMVVCYDADGLGITSQNHMFQAGTNTTLAADLVPGATTVQLTSAANWNNAATSGYQRTITVWGYTNAKGYTYPDYTYTRRYVSDAYANGGISGNTITLSAPWPATWGTIPAGTAVSNGTAGGTYKYVAGLNNVATTTWTTYTGEIGGVDLTGTNAYYGFSPGTAYIQLGWLLNYNSTANSVLNLSAISFSEVSSGQLRSMTKYDSTLSGVDWFTVKSAGATPALSVDVTNYRVGIGKTAPTVPLDVSGAAAISGTLSVTGATTLSDALNLSGSQHTIKNATPSTLNFAKGSQFGYSSGYRTIVLGDTGTSNKTSLAFGVDVVDIADGATWAGDGREVIFRNAQEFMTPNSGRTAFIKPMKWDSSGNTTMLGLTASSATINGSITQTSGAIASVNNSTAKLRLGRLNSANAPTTISTDNYYIELGSAEYNTNSYRLMGFGYRAASHMPAYLGYQEKDISGFTKGDLIFGTRDVTTDTEPTERMRIAASGLSTFAGDVTLSKASPVLGLSASSGTPSLNIDSPAAAYDTYLNFRTGTSARWSWSKGGTESGTNAGSNLYLYAYSDAGALLSTPLTITRSTGAVALTGDLTVGPNKTLSLDASAGSATSLKFTTSGTNRWLLQKTNTAESGANAGSDLVLYARDDSGNAIGTALSITRSTMAATFGGSVTAASFSTTGTTTTAGIKRALVTKTAAYTLTTSDNIVVATTGTWNATLPTAVSAAGTEYIIKNSGTGTITVDTTSSQTIDGSTTIDLAQYDSLTVVSDGTNWVIV